MENSSIFFFIVPVIRLIHRFFAEGKKSNRVYSCSHQKELTMKVEELGLVWIVVKDVKASIKYYTEVVGLKLMEFSEEYGWAELSGHNGGVFLGLAQENAHDDMKAGNNAVMTFTVADLDKALENMLQKGAKAEGEVLEIPGHVKMQTMVDADGNKFQMCQKLTHSCCHC